MLDFGSNQVSGYAGYSYYEDKSSGVDDIKNANVLMGTAALFMAVVMALELVLGFLNMDNNQIFGGFFLFVCLVAVVLQLASAALATEQAKDTDDDDNYKASAFFLYASPMSIRIMVGILKYFDIQMAGGAASA